MRSYKLKILIIFIELIILISDINFSYSYTRPNNLSSNLVETFGSINLLAQYMPLNRLEKRWKNQVNGIHFLVESDSDNLPFKNDYGAKRYRYLMNKLSFPHLGLTFNIVNDQLFLSSRGEGETFEERNEFLINKVSSLINKSRCSYETFNIQTEVNSSENKYQVNFNIDWINSPKESDYLRYKYLLFLVADQFLLEDGCIYDLFENLACDFIPLEGDDPKTFDGSGLNLINPKSQRKINNSFFTLKTVEFKIPETDQEVSWYLYLIIEDPDNLGKKIFTSKLWIR